MAGGIGVESAPGAQIESEERAARPGQHGLLVLLALAGLGLALVWSLPWPTWGEFPVLQEAAEKLQTFSTFFLGIFIEALPFLLLGVFASALIHRFVSDAFITRVARLPPLLAALGGGVLGMAFPVCECGVIPVSRRLLSKGAPLPLAIAFILAGPVINPVVLASTWIAFGGNPTMALARFGFVLAVAIAVALVFSLHPRPTSLLTPLASPVDTCCSHHPPDEGKGIGSLLRQATDEFFEMGKYLVVGGLLAAAVQTFVPRAALLAVGQDPALSVAAMMALAVLLSICSTVDAFVALSFAGTFNAGAILAFLAFGPMVDIKNTLMLTTTFRRPAIVLLILLSAQLVFLVAAFVNLNWG